MWNSITNLGNVLTDGLDLIISNLAIDASAMGIVAIAKVPSTILNTVISSISNVFQPQIIQYYSKDDLNSVVNETKKSMKICGIFGNIPFCYIIVFGFAFCKWWMPDIKNSILGILCIITFINIFVGGLITPLYNVFTITNRVRGNAILNILSGVLSTIIVLIFLNFTTLGVYAIVGVSTLIGVLKGFIIIPMYSASCLKINLKTFFPIILKYMLTFVVMLFLFFILKLVIIPYNLLTMVLSILICGILGLLANYFIFLDKDDRKVLFDLIYLKLRRN